jgi:GWxTD domain-containing protein
MFTECKTGNEIRIINLAYLYEDDTKPMIAGSRVFIENDSMARVYVIFNLAELVYLRPPGKSAFFAKAKLSYQIYNNYESNKLIDSGSFPVNDSVNYRKEKFVVFDFPVKIQPVSNHLLNLYFNDLNSERGTTTPIEIRNTSAFSAQHFLPLDSTGTVIFQPWIPYNDGVQLQCADTSKEKIFVSYYKRSYPPALPPFSTNETSFDTYPADRVFTLKVRNGITELLNFPDKGIYLFRNDSTANEGFTLFRFDDGYPGMKRPEQMIFPLRYLCSNREFEKLTQSRNPEWAINDFWFEAGGIDERANELRNEYFNRVNEANRYFTSYKEGWKTDRGMIYLIFGEPSTVYRRTGIETWVFSQQGDRVSLSFDFYQAENPFSNADYKLRRLPEYKNPWFLAVDYWRR